VAEPLRTWLRFLEPEYRSLKQGAARADIQAAP